MRILVVGGSGTIGKAIVAAVRERKHDVVSVGRNSGDIQADISDFRSIKNMYEKAGAVDAVVCAAGAGRFKPLSQLTEDDFAFSLANKLMGQVNLIRYGLDHVKGGGSITVTSGVLTESPIPGSAALSLVNGGLEAFVRAAALEAPRGIRVNVVSPDWVSETLEAMKQDPSKGIPASIVAKSYLESIDGKMTGRTIKIHAFKVA